MTYPKKQAEAQMIFRKTGGFVQGNMTLRDHFAGLAMNGLLETAIDWFPTGKAADESSLEIFKDLARDSYAIADAMLEERIK